MPVTLKCQQCGKMFEVSPSKETLRKFCSRECYNNNRGKPIVVTCLQCGKTFKTIPSKIQKGGGKYCSRQCRAKAHEKKLKRECKYCGKPFKAPKRLVTKGYGNYCSRNCFAKDNSTQVKRVCKICGKVFSSAQKKVKEGYGIYCSTKCQNKGISGENSPAWKGGISFEPYCLKFNNEFKERVRNFWEHKCGICGKLEGKNGRKLHVHHANYDKMVCCNNVAPLFMALCSSCHSKTNNKRDYWEEMLTNYIMIWFDGESYNSAK